MKEIFTLQILIIILIISACERGEIVKDGFSYGDIKNVTAEQWDKLAKKRIFFGHQSVGGNIVEGMKDVLKNNPQIKIAILNSDKPGDLKEGIFEHSEIGRNEDPESKINAFSKLVSPGVGSNADIAFFKFCYVDITASTNVETLFKNYMEKMGQLEKEYPDVKFIHFTVPLLRQPEKSIKSSIKKLLGRGNGFFDVSHNIARNIYNELLKSAYEGKEPVFDLARLEAISPDKNLCFFDYQGKRMLSLCPEYTDDGGHLNAVGRKAVAEQLLVFLAALK
jgi:hypothetical protein